MRARTPRGEHWPHGEPAAPPPLLEHDAIFGRQGARRLNIRRIDCCPLFCSNPLERDRRDTLCGSARARRRAADGGPRVTRRARRP
eukprot:1609927-Prymnesium_polylepis.1